jgi:hypothetical protein
MDLVITCQLFIITCVHDVQSKMAYDVSATPLQRIFPQFLSMIVQFYRTGKAAAVINAAAAATADNLAQSLIFFGNHRHRRVMGREVTSCWYGASLVQASCNNCAMPATF